MGIKIRASMREKASEFMETNKKWWYDLNFRHPWMGGLVVYGSIFLVCILVLYGIFAKANIFQGTEANSARYMLSALIQSQAAIVAIVLIVTQIAIQLTPSYSPRVKIDLFRNNHAMWILLILYGVSIFYSLIVLRLIKGQDGEVVGQSVIWSLGHISISFEWLVSIALLLGVFTYVALFPYMMTVFGISDPVNRIKRLLKRSTRDRILNYIKAKQKAYETSTKKDPVQPIVDIIYGSVRIHDRDTTGVGLKGIVELAINIINRDEEKGISKYFCHHLRQVGIYAAGIADEESIIEVIDTLETFGKSTVAKDLKDAPREATVAIGAVGEAAVKKYLENAVKQAVKSLTVVGEAAAEKGKELKVATEEAAKSLGAVGKAAVENRLEDATMQAVLSLEVVGETAVEKGLEDATRQAVLSLEVIGKTAVENRLEDATRQAVLSLGAVGKTAAEKGKEPEDATEQAVLSLEVVGEAAAKKYLENATRQAVESLEVVGKTAAKGKRKTAVKKVAKSLERVGKASMENRLLDTTRRAIESLVAIGKFKEPQAGKSLEAIGVTAVENGLQDTAKHAIVSLEAVAKYAADKDLADFLGTLGEAAAKKGKDFEEVVMKALRSLRAIGVEAIEKGWDAVISRTIISLSHVGTEAANKGQELEREVIQSAWFLKDIGEKAIKAGNKEKEVERVVDALRVIEKISVGKGIDEVSEALGVIENMTNDSKSST